LARKVRVFIKDMPQHVFLKSIEELIIFQDEEDYQTFLYFLELLGKKFNFFIHAYILKPTYFELLGTPQNEDSLSRFMQNLSRNYVLYYNKKYNRTGTIWEGRYKSSLVEESYIFDVMKFIELQDDKEYRYSSIGKNLYNKKDNIITFHKVYKELGYTPQVRNQKYSEILNQGLDEEKREFVKVCLEKQLVTGSVEFIKDLENIIGKSLISRGRGRPRKTKERKMYKNLVVLDKEKHSSLKIKPMENLNFARGLAYVPVMASEVELVGKVFPVVFTAEEEPSLVALVSLGGESLAITEDGKWISSYVPLFLRRYPFSLASTKENPDQKIVLIDEESELVNKKSGQALFSKDGEQTETLTHAINFLNAFEEQSNITKNVAKLISDSGILEDREITVGEGEESKTLVDGFKVVNREKLNELSDDILADWVRKGIINMIEAHIKSLENIDTLFKLAMQKQNIK